MTDIAWLPNVELSITHVLIVAVLTLVIVKGELACEIEQLVIDEPSWFNEIPVQPLEVD